MGRQHVIIVGAGAAGLIAARDISQKYDVTIIETRNETGGRIRSLRMNDSEGIVECGAEFVHGNTPVTNKLIREAQLEIVKLNGKMLRKEGKEWSEEEDMIEGWDELVEKMKGQRKDVTMHDFVMKHFSDDRYVDLRRHIYAFVQGFDVADPKEVSVQSLYREWSKESDQFRITTGYHSLIEFLEQACRKNGCTILTGETVRQVDWQNNDVTVYTASGKKIFGNKVVITLPVSVLRDLKGKTSINITPPLDAYADALKHIGFGTVVKVSFEMKKKIWKDKTGFIFSNEKIPTWWTQYPAKNNLITGWAGGPMASTLSQHTDDELTEIGLRSLSNIFDLEIGELRNITGRTHIFNWSKYDESLGAYSYSTPDSSNARKLLNTPVENTVFFSGEGLYDGEFSGTVEAALTSGLNTAAAVLNSE